MRPTGEVPPMTASFTEHGRISSTPAAWLCTAVTETDDAARKEAFNVRGKYQKTPAIYNIADF